MYLALNPLISTTLRGTRHVEDFLTGADAVLSQYSLDESFSSGDGLWESTILDVQVKSKVVLPESSGEKHPSPVKPSPVQPPPVQTFRAGHRITPPPSKRPRVFDMPEEWSREKKRYVKSVSQHLKENRKGGVMTELLDLMNTVANEQHPWQHPSDLTIRNYQPGNHGQSLYSLEEWRQKNGGGYKRFSNF